MADMTIREMTGNETTSIKPLSPSEILEVLAAAREAHSISLIHLQVYLSNPSEPVLERLTQSRKREDELFKVILWRDKRFRSEAEKARDYARVKERRAEKKMASMESQP